MFFFGGAPSIADFSIYHCLWFVTRGGPMAKILDSHPALLAWRERIGAVGHGSYDKLDGVAAVAAARNATAEKSTGNVDSHGIALGDRVVIAATDTGVDPIEGTLYGAARDRISIAREDSRAGSVVVHFPRLGFELRRVT